MIYMVDSEFAGILSPSQSLHWLPLCSDCAKEWFGALGPPRFPLVPDENSVCYDKTTTK